MKPLVSIIVPVYNTQNYLATCLDSLIGQTLQDIEIICVNDCSTDNSLLVLQEYAKIDPRIRIVDLQENRKQGGARNAGIKLAKSPYFAFVDSDDWADKTMFETLYRKACECNADLASCDYLMYHSNTNITVCKNFDSSVFALPTDERNRIFLLNGVRLWTCLFKNSLFFDNDLFFPEHLSYEDNAIVAAMGSYTFEFNADGTVVYTENTYGTTTAYNGTWSLSGTSLTMDFSGSSYQNPSLISGTGKIDIASDGSSFTFDGNDNFGNNENWGTFYRK